MRARAVDLITRPGSYYGPKIAALLLAGAALGITLAKLPIELAACCMLLAAAALALLM